MRESLRAWTSGLDLSSSSSPGSQLIAKLLTQGLLQQLEQLLGEAATVDETVESLSNLPEFIEREFLLKQAYTVFETPVGSLVLETIVLTCRCKTATQISNFRLEDLSLKSQCILLNSRFPVSCSVMQRGVLAKDINFSKLTDLEPLHELISGQLERLTFGDRVSLKELRNISLLEQGLRLFLDDVETLPLQLSLTDEDIVLVLRSQRAKLLGINIEQAAVVALLKSNKISFHGKTDLILGSHHFPLKLDVQLSAGGFTGRAIPEGTPEFRLLTGLYLSNYGIRFPDTAGGLPGFVSNFSLRRRASCSPQEIGNVEGALGSALVNSTLIARFPLGFVLSWLNLLEYITEQSLEGLHWLAPIRLHGIGNEPLKIEFNPAEQHYAFDGRLQFYELFGLNAKTKITGQQVSLDTHSDLIKIGNMLVLSSPGNRELGPRIRGNMTLPFAPETIKFAVDGHLELLTSLKTQIHCVISAGALDATLTDRFELGGLTVSPNASLKLNLESQKFIFKATVGFELKLSWKGISFRARAARFDMSFDSGSSKASIKGKFDANIPGVSIKGLEVSLSFDLTDLRDMTRLAEDEVGRNINNFFKIGDNIMNSVGRTLGNFRDGLSGAGDIKKAIKGLEDAMNKMNEELGNKLNDLKAELKDAIAAQAKMIMDSTKELIGSLQQKMEEQFSEVKGLLVETRGLILQTHEEQKKLMHDYYHQLENHLQRMENEAQRRFDQVDAKLTDMTRRMDTRFDRVDESLQDLSQQLTNEFDTVTSQMKMNFKELSEKVSKDHHVLVDHILGVDSHIGMVEQKVQALQQQAYVNQTQIMEMFADSALDPFHLEQEIATNLSISSDAQVRCFARFKMTANITARIAAIAAVNIPKTTSAPLGPERHINVLGMPGLSETVNPAIWVMAVLEYLSLIYRLQPEQLKPAKVLTDVSEMIAQGEQVQGVLRTLSTAPVWSCFFQQYRDAIKQLRLEMEQLLWPVESPVRQQIQQGVLKMLLGQPMMVPSDLALAERMAQACGPSEDTYLIQAIKTDVPVAPLEIPALRLALSSAGGPWYVAHTGGSTGSRIRLNDFFVDTERRERRGLNVAIINHENHTLKKFEVFDTHAGQNHAQDFVRFVDANLSPGNILAIVIVDDAHYWLAPAKDRLKELGALNIDSLECRSPWVFVSRDGKALLNRMGRGEGQINETLFVSLEERSEQRALQAQTSQSLHIRLLQSNTLELKEKFELTADRAQLLSTGQVLAREGRNLRFYPSKPLHSAGYSTQAAEARQFAVELKDYLVVVNHHEIVGGSYRYSIDIYDARTQQYLNPLASGLHYESGVFIQALSDNQLFVAGEHKEGLFIVRVYEISREGGVCLKEGNHPVSGGGRNAEYIRFLLVAPHDHHALITGHNDRTSDQSDAHAYLLKWKIEERGITVVKQYLSNSTAIPVCGLILPERRSVFIGFHGWGNAATNYSVIEYEYGTFNYKKQMRARHTDHVINLIADSTKVFSSSNNEILVHQIDDGVLLLKIDITGSLLLGIVANKELQQAYLLEKLSQQFTITSKQHVTNARERADRVFDGSAASRKLVLDYFADEGSRSLRSTLNAQLRTQLSVPALVASFEALDHSFQVFRICFSLAFREYLPDNDFKSVHQQLLNSETFKKHIDQDGNPFVYQWLLTAFQERLNRFEQSVLNMALRCEKQEGKRCHYPAIEETLQALHVLKTSMSSPLVLATSDSAEASAGSEVAAVSTPLFFSQSLQQQNRAIYREMGQLSEPTP